MPLRNCTVDERIVAARYSFSYGISEAAVTYNVSERTIKRWRSKLPQLAALSVKSRNKKRIFNSGSQASGQELMDFAATLRANHKIVNCTSLTEFFMHKHSIPVTADSFKKTRQKIYRMVRNSNLTLRRGTHQSKVDLHDAAQLHAAFIADYHTVMEEFRPQVVINMDETPLVFGLTCNETLAPVGSKTVIIRKFGDSKKTITAALAVTASGEKLDPFLIFDGTRNGRVARELAVGDGYPPELHATCNANHWMTTQDMLVWLETVVLPFVGDRRYLLVLDAFRGHWKSEFITAVQNTNGHLLQIPPNITHIAQPLDISVNKPLKDRINRAKIIDSIASIETGQRKIGRREMAKYLCDAWREISQEVILNGWIKAGLQ
jgi:hypothetical protein